MSQTAILPAREDGFTRKKWSIEECRVLVNSGLLLSGKYELIEGEIVSKIGQSRLHTNAVAILFTLLAALFPRAVQTQASIGIGAMDAFNDPEPDVAVLRGTLNDYRERDPDPNTDVLLVVEVSLTTLPGDRTTKARLYARHGIPEYWIVALANRELIVHRQPGSEGYGDVRAYEADESVTCLAAPVHPIQAAALLP